MSAEIPHAVAADPVRFAPLAVGTARELEYAEIGAQRYACTDKGLLSRLASHENPSKLRSIAALEWWQSPVAATFHGRDIVAPVAARLNLGLDPDELGPPLPELVSLDWHGAAKVAHRIDGEVTSIDSFGNLVTNLTRDQLAGVPTDASVTIVCDDHETHGIFKTYGEQPPMTLVAVVGSSGMLEIAIVDDSAATMLGVGVGAPVQVRW